KKRELLFNQIILTAPDIDAAAFVRDVIPKIQKAGMRTTLYASSRDRALAFSEKVNGGHARAGTAGKNIVVAKGIETVDVSAVDTNFIGHFYYGDNRSVISDLFYVIRGSPPAERSFLQMLKKNDIDYWRFRP